MASERIPTAQEPPRCTACGQIMRLITVSPRSSMATSMSIAILASAVARRPHLFVDVRGSSSERRALHSRKAPSLRPNQRVYAVGDVVTDLRQLTVATGHAAVAATNIHNRLPTNFRSYPRTHRIFGLK